VRKACLERNFAGCPNSVGTLLRCNPEDLSAGQRERVERRNIAANLYLCTNSLMGCNEDWLTPEQRERFALIRATLARCRSTRARRRSSSGCSKQCGGTQ
jgi:hypothetical protein